MNSPTTRALHSAPTSTPERQAFYNKIEGVNLRPLWELMPNLAVMEPRPAAQPVIWRYDDVRPLLMETVPLISVEEAERRVLSLANPGLRPRSQITSSMMAGLQLVLPGEVAPAHRHTQSALRFVIEGSGAYTAVDGEKTEMNPGDFVITPSWTWHDHGNETKIPMVWLDVLDVPLVGILEAGFAEAYNASKQIIGRPVGDALARYGSGMLPVDFRPKSKTSPVFNYPYRRTREALEAMRRSEEWDPHHGLKVQFVNPQDGESAIPTIGTFMQLLPKGFKGEVYRSTDGTVFSPVEGKGRTTVIGTDGQEVVIQWKARDIFVIPSWARHRHEAEVDSVLFSASDRPVQQKFGLWREVRSR